MRERAPRYHLQRYLWFLNESIISKRKKYSGFCKILISVPQHGKITQSSVFKSHIDHFTTVGWTLDLGLFMVYKQFVALAEIMLHSAGGKNQGCRNLSKLYFRDRTGQTFPKTFIFFHLMQWTPNPSMLHHTFKLKRAVKHVEDRARDKRTTLINVTDCIQSAGSINHVKS